MSDAFAIAPAAPQDVLALRRMHRLSLVELTHGASSRHQIDGLLATVETVDPALVAEGRYFAGRIRGCIAASAGYALRRGGSGTTALVRAVFVHPDFARRGLGTAMLNHVEREAAARGAARMELVTTLGAEPFCRALGYRAIGPVEWPLVNGARFEGLRMGRPVQALRAAA